MKPRFHFKKKATSFHSSDITKQIWKNHKAVGWGPKQNHAVISVVPGGLSMSFFDLFLMFYQSNHKRCFKIFSWVKFLLLQFNSVQSLNRVWLFVTPWTTAHQASLSTTNFWSLPKPMSIESVMPSNHLILCRPLLLLPSIFPNIRVFSNESALHIRWPKYWSFSFSISPSNEYSGLISFRMDWFPLGWTDFL